MQQLLLLIIVLSLPIFLFSQPQPCDDPPVMTSVCADACIICDIDGFKGRHEATIVGEAPPGFAGECTMVAHNMQWIAFIAGSENLKVTMAVSNCELALGLEFGLYKGINCENYERISNCFGGFNSIGPGESGTIENTEPLIIGQYYYIVMDGGLGDNCDWTFTVEEGSTKSSPLETSGIIEGNLASCPDVEQMYTITPPTGATEFDWTLNGRNLGINADFNVSCFASNDGTITIIPEGGTAPYNYEWGDGAILPNRQQLLAGAYIATITDKMGCLLEAEITLSEPTALDLVASFVDPNCEGLSSGKVVAETVFGGVMPYFYTLNEEGFSPNPEFNNLSEGNYKITAEDANGCEIEAMGVLTAPIIPTINLGPDLTIELADEIQLNPKVLEEVETALWRADTGLSCYNCPMPIAAPTNPTIYKVTVSSIDGCTATDSVLIRILKVRDVYVPNAFSPNQDGLNDILFIHAGPEVNNIQSFSIYSRWGEKVFGQQNFAPNDIAFGWDGKIANESLNSGVFIWQAVIDFIDGETLVYTGDVVLIR